MRSSNDRLSILIVATLLGACDASIAQTETATRPIDSSRECLPRSALSGADIVLLGQYGGQGVAVPYQLKGAQHGTRVTAVTGDPGRPVVLVLSAYESTIWDLSRVPANAIKGVVASGFYAQGVTGLPSRVPTALRHRSADNAVDNDVDATACPDLDFAYSGSKVRDAGGRIKSALGKYPAEFFGAYATAGYDLTNGPPPYYTDEPRGKPVTERPPVTDGLRSGHEGIRQLVATGVLRPVSQADLQRWNRQGASFEPLNMMARMTSGTIAIPSLSLGGFLIARNVTRLPGGLDGAHSVTFIVPEGISAPVGMQTHSQFYKIRGIRGVPATSAMSIDEALPFDRMRNMARGQASGPLHHARWRPDGSLIEETGGTSTSGDQSEGGWQIGPLSGNPLRGIQTMPMTATIPGPSAMVDDVSVQTGPAQAPERDMTLTAMISGILIALGALGLVLQRRYPAQPHENQPVVTSTSRGAEALIEQMPADVADEMDRLSRQLQEAIDISRDDDTALVLLKFKRTVMRALQEPDYDEDLASELDAIVDQHMAETVAIYVKAARRTTASRIDVLEANLRNGVQRLTGRIEEIVERQSARDSDKLRERDDFIQARHPGASDLGDAR